MTQNEFFGVKIKEMKQIAVHAQLYEAAANFRDIERKFERGGDWRTEITSMVIDYSKKPKLSDFEADILVILKQMDIQELRRKKIDDLLNGED